MREIVVGHLTTSPDSELGVTSRRSQRDSLKDDLPNRLITV
jgi:hypothetical protein